MNTDPHSLPRLSPSFTPVGAARSPVALMTQSQAAWNLQKYVQRA